MANEDQLEILRRGVVVWNLWIAENWVRKNSQVEIDLRDANLDNGILLNVNFSHADLSNVNLKNADLEDAHFQYANLHNANLENSDLEDAHLEYANLHNANLKNANLKNANLKNAKLMRVTAIHTNFSYANLTGACIEDWNINSGTILDNVVCDYIYLKYYYDSVNHKFIYQDRRPHDPNKNFAPGEFTKLFQKALETVDLIFTEGIDWKAFLVSFEKLQIECNSDELSINSFENKGNGTFVVRVNVPQQADKGEIEKYLEREYQIQLKAIEEKYRWQLYGKDKEIEIYRKDKTDLLEIVKLLSSKSIYIMNTQQSKTQNVNQNIKENNGEANATGGNTHKQTGKFAIGKMSGGSIENSKVAAEIHEGEAKDLAKAAAEIQQLLEQLSQTYPTSTTKEKMTVVGEAVDIIENNPTLKTRIVNSLKAGGIEAFKEIIDHPLVNILMSAMEGWREV